MLYGDKININCKCNILKHRKTFFTEAKRDHSDEDCFACVILTHGSCYYRVNSEQQFHTREDMIMAADEPFLTRDILQLFQDNKCKTLKGKPKLFFIQVLDQIFTYTKQDMIRLKTDCHFEMSKESVFLYI